MSFDDFLNAMTAHIAAVQRANAALAEPYIGPAVLTAILDDCMRNCMTEDDMQEILLIAQVA